MEITKEYLLGKGFKDVPHLILPSNWVLDIGRLRSISIGSLGTPNEMVFLSQKDHPKDICPDLVCVHNYDYDGFLTIEKLESLLSVFK